MVWLADGEKCLVINLADRQNTAVWHTDRQTDRQRDRHLSTA